MDLDKRLQMAQLLSALLKQDKLVKFVGKPQDESEDASRKEVEVYLKEHLQNLLLNVMGEVPTDAFSKEETAILKSMVAKIRQGVK